MDYNINVKEKYLGIPVFAERKEVLLEIFAGEAKLYEFMVSAGEAGTTCDYYFYLDVEMFKGKTLTLKGNPGKAFWEGLLLTDSNERPQLVRPLIHFTADRGWINDPNGLVYHDGIYHLYFQYNPVNTKWENMSWGHACSKDLLHFETMEPALYPDMHGTMYSGCGLVNEQGLLGIPKDALLFFYTAAANKNKWSRGKKGFTQRLAYSVDGGKTLIKYSETIVDVIKEESRDPKVFWHPETQAYVMVLWLEGNEFAILRSVDLQSWEITDRFVYEDAWECPDLLRLKDGDGEQWVFMSADGFYYYGDFDGYHFRSDGKKRMAYLTNLPYAAQSYSGTGDRTIIIPWLRTLNPCKMYTGMMGIPREAAIAWINGEKYLQLLPIREHDAAKKEIAGFEAEEDYTMELTEEAVCEVYLKDLGKGDVTVSFQNWRLRFTDDGLYMGEDKTVLPKPFEEVHILIDREILEIYGNNGTQNAYFETDSQGLKGRLDITGTEVSGKLYRWN